VSPAPRRSRGALSGAAVSWCRGRLGTSAPTAARGEPSRSMPTAPVLPFASAATVVTERRSARLPVDGAAPGAQPVRPERSWQRHRGRRRGRRPRRLLPEPARRSPAPGPSQPFHRPSQRSRARPLQRRAEAPSLLPRRSLRSPPLRANRPHPFPRRPSPHRP
jgi:hypothetical protein